MVPHTCRTESADMPCYGVGTMSRSLKLYVSFAKEPYERDDILQKRRIISRSLLIVATPYMKVFVLCGCLIRDLFICRTKSADILCEIKNKIICGMKGDLHTCRTKSADMLSADGVTVKAMRESDVELLSVALLRTPASTWCTVCMNTYTHTNICTHTHTDTHIYMNIRVNMWIYT